MEKTKGNGLRELHALHIELQDVQEKLDRGPKTLKARQQGTQQKQAELESARQKQKALKMAADQKSLQYKSGEAKIHDLKGKLNAASSNREFDIIKSQIEADTVANSVLEDEILDHLEKVDAGQVAIHKLDEELASSKADETRTAEKNASSLEGLHAKAADLQKQITAAESVLPPDVTIVYRRLVQAHGAGALAEVDGATCTSCYVGLPPQTVVVLNAGQILFCKTCGRLLYPRREG